MRRLLIVAGVLAVVALLFWAATDRSIRAHVRTMERGPVRAFVEEEGQTRVVDRYRVTAQVAGRLQRVQLKEGEAVEAGQIVAEIDPLALESRVAELRARIDALRHDTEGVERKKPKPEELERARVLADRARAAHAAAQKQLDVSRTESEDAAHDAERARTLRETESITLDELEDAVKREQQAKGRLAERQALCRVTELNIRASELESSIVEARTKDFDWEDASYRARITGAEAELRSLTDDLQRTRIVAPTAGVVLERFRESEQHVEAGAPILEIGDLSRMVVEADFLSEDAARMRPGMTAELFGRALGDKVIPASVERIYPSAFEKISSLGVEQQRVTVIVAFDGAAGVGDRYRVDVRIVLDERADVLLVPEGALFRHEGSWSVFKDIGGKATLTPVEIGIGDGRVREVLSGLEMGDRVVLHPPRDLEEGSSLRAIE